jgi:hypothetical protein
MVVSGFFNWVEDGLQRWLYLLAAGLAMLLTAEPMAYSIIIVFAVIILLRLADFKTLWAQGLRRSVAVEAVPRETKEGKAPSRSGSRSKNKGLNPNLRRAGIFLLVAIILFSTAATLNLSGFGVTTNLLADWLSRFGVQSQAQAGFNAVFLLTIYEPLLVVSGLVGLVYALLSRNLLRLVFAGWFLGILVLDLAMVGRPNGNVILSLLPLVFLAALALAELWPGLQQGASWANEGIILASCRRGHLLPTSLAAGRGGAGPVLGHCRLFLVYQRAGNSYSGDSPDRGDAWLDCRHQHRLASELWPVDEFGLPTSGRRARFNGAGFADRNPGRRVVNTSG